MEKPLGFFHLSKKMQTKESLKGLDKRLVSRRDLFLDRLVSRRSCVLHQLSRSWKEEMGLWRFLGNPRFGWESLRTDILCPIGEKVAGRHVLSIQDGSTISLKGYLTGRKGFGQTGTQGDHPGFEMHPALVLDAQDGGCIGLAALELHEGNALAAPVKQDQRRKGAEAGTKKTGVWLRVGSATRRLLNEAAQVTHIADREADFFEMMLEFGQKKVSNEAFIVRSNADRLLGHRLGRGQAPNGGPPDLLFETGLGGPPLRLPYKSPMSGLLGQLPARATCRLKLPATHKRKKRTALVEIRFAQQVPLCRSRQLYGRTYEGERLPGSVRVAIVEVREVTPDLSPGQELIYWRLFTSHPVHSVEGALQIVKWYTFRWKIELFFAAAKSQGLDLEHARIEHAPRLKKLAVLVAMATVQVIQLLQARDGNSEQPISDVFSAEEAELIVKINPKLEGKTDLLKNPHKPNSLAFATWVIARLGGWKGYKTHRPPGIKTISRGLLAFFQLKNAIPLLSG